MSNSSKAPARAIGIAIVIAAITTSAYFMLVKAPAATGNKLYELAQKVGKDIDDIIHFRPRITSSGITLLKESNTIKELSTTERLFDHTHTWDTTWLGSTKRIEYKGKFRAKAGYDLTQPFSIDISADGKTIRAHMPSTRINSVEQLKLEVIRDENGVWNKITPQEREQALNALLQNARASLEKIDILKEADKAFMSQLEEAIRKSTPSGAEIIREPLP